MQMTQLQTRPRREWCMAAVWRRYGPRSEPLSVWVIGVSPILSHSHVMGSAFPPDSSLQTPRSFTFVSSLSLISWSTVDLLPILLFAAIERVRSRHAHLNCLGPPSSAFGERLRVLSLPAQTMMQDHGPEVQTGRASPPLGPFGCKCSCSWPRILPL